MDLEQLTFKFPAIKMEALERPQIIVHLEKSLNYTVFDTKWIPTSAKFVSLGSHPKNTGAMQIYEMAKGELKLIKEVGIFPHADHAKFHVRVPM